MVDGRGGDDEALTGDLAGETSYGTRDCDWNAVSRELV